MKNILVLASMLLMSFAAVAQNSITHVKTGDNVPEFKVTMLDGTSIDMASLRGKVVVLNFWATWCPPCRIELKRVQKDLIDRFKDKDFVFLPISRGEQRSVVEKFMKSNGYTFPVGLDPDQKIFKLFANNSIPRNFVVNAKGVVVAVEIGYSEELFQDLLVNIERALGDK